MGKLFHLKIDGSIKNSLCMNYEAYVHLTTKQLKYSTLVQWRPFEAVQ